MHLSIIVPIYNEINIIQKNLTKIYECFKDKYDFEIIVVNDGSTDDSKKILEKLKIPNLHLINNIKNFGKGYSLVKGISKSIGEIVLITDADLSTPVNEFFKLQERLKDNVDIIIGSRAMHDSNVKIKQNLIRILMGEIFNFFVRYILNLKYKDTQCGFKIFKGKVIRKIVKFSRILGFCIDVEILFLAKKFNLKVLEIGVVWSDDSTSTVNLFYDPIKMFFDLFEIRFKRYNKFKD
jgi:dolichyl-phosphate beta-glucosyltransferase